MAQNETIQLVLYLLAILVCVKPLGLYMAGIYQNKNIRILKIGVPIERLLYRFCNVDPEQPMNWREYLAAMLFFNLFAMLAMYALQRLQTYLPLNPQHFTAVSPDLAFNTAASVVTNTGWQSYAGENSLSIFSQSVGIVPQSFLSAATGMSLLVAFIRGISQHEISSLGNYWKDMLRSVIYILLPLSILLSLILVSQGVIQNYKAYAQVSNLEKSEHSEKILPMGPVASLVAIKQISSDGAGFFNVNSSHPFENPTPLSNFFQIIAMLLIPAAFCYTFGVMVNDKRQGWAIFIAMLIIFTPAASIVVNAEKTGNPVFSTFDLQGNVNNEGKEMRLQIFNSAFWATATTATGSGTTNCMLGSMMPISGGIILTLMHLGEIVFGGVGSGLYGMILLVMITVFISGLMIGRTPEYLGKKIDPFEMKMISLVVLIMPLIGLIFTAWASVTVMGTSALGNPGAHGFSEMLYAFTSMRNNNGSAFAGLNANNLFYNISGGVVMLISRYWQAIATLAVAGTLSIKKITPNTTATLATHNWLFISMLLAVTIFLGVLSFLPTLALGPIAEYISIRDAYEY